MKRLVYIHAPFFAVSLWLALSCKSAGHASEQPAAEEASKAAAPVLPMPDHPLAAGEVVNDFQALAHTGERVRLSRYLDKPALVYFCAQDSAPACLGVATGLRDQWLKLNAQVSMAFGVSQEDRQIHNAFATEQKLPFLMLADSGQQLEKTFGVAPGAQVAYLIGADRKVLRVFNALSGAALAAEVLRALTQLGLLRPEYPI